MPQWVGNMIKGEGEKRHSWEKTIQCHRRMATTLRPAPGGGVGGGSLLLPD